jgi:type VI protein secretion system component Hcp
MRVLQDKALRRAGIVLAGALVLAIPAQAPAAEDSILHLSGIQGESTNEHFLNDIDVANWSWAADRSSGAAKATTHDITITKRVDRASPALLQRLYSGQTITDGALINRTVSADPITFLKFCFTGLRVTSVKVSGEEEANEEVSFSFATLVEKYTQQNGDGSAGQSFTFGWDLLKYLQLSQTTQDAC